MAGAGAVSPSNAERTLPGTNKTVENRSNPTSAYTPEIARVYRRRQVCRNRLRLSGTGSAIALPTPGDPGTTASLEYFANLVRIETRQRCLHYCKQLRWGVIVTNDKTDARPAQDEQDIDTSERPRHDDYRHGLNVAPTDRLGTTVLDDAPHFRVVHFDECRFVVLAEYTPDKPPADT